MKNRQLTRKLALMAVVATLTACAGGNNKEKADQAELRPHAVPVTVRERSNRESELNNAVVASGQMSDVRVDVNSHPPASDGDQALRKRPQQAPNVLAGLSVASQTQCCPLAPTESVNRDQYASYEDNPVSTFSIDVDTGSYSNVRRFLASGQLPPRDAVRVEEMINYFSYDYPVPNTVDEPFNVITEVARTPWNADTLLMHVGLKGFEVTRQDRKASNLVFLVDVSGSMRSSDKLPLLKDALKTLTRHLDERDSVAIAGYAGGAGIILEPTNGSESRRIIESLDQLTAAGRTNGAAGIHLAYELAQRNFIPGGINRVILATDGDFNVGTVNFEALVNLVEEKRRAGVALTALGFGRGNYNDKLLEQVADAGNGNYAYIDNQREARKVLVEEMTSTLQTIARDVKIQIEFNPATVAEYRLIGYENRMLKREDFNNDQIDAGEIGAGHTVTALYEITPVGSPAQLNDPLRYSKSESRRSGKSNELAMVRLRYKQPDADQSQLIERTVKRSHLSRMNRDFRFAAAVSAFGQRLRGADYLQSFDLDDIAELAEDGIGHDPNGYREEFISLVSQAMRLTESVARTTGADHPYHVAN